MTSVCSRERPAVTSVFYSHNFPATADQRRLVALTEHWLCSRGFLCTTAKAFLASDQPTLAHIRSAIASADQVLVMAFQRDGDALVDAAAAVKVYQQTSPWVHMEAAMAFQLGKRVTLFQQNSLAASGVFDLGATGLAVTRFDMAASDSDFMNLLEGALGRTDNIG